MHQVTTSHLSPDQITCSYISISFTYFRGRGEGYFHQNCMWMCLPYLENLTFSIPTFSLISHLSVCHFRKKSTQFWPNWMLFTIMCQNTPTSSYNLGSFISDDPLRSQYQILRKKRFKRQAYNMYTMSMWEPPSTISFIYFNPALASDEWGPHGTYL